MHKFFRELETCAVGSAIDVCMIQENKVDVRWQLVQTTTTLFTRQVKQRKTELAALS